MNNPEIGSPQWIANRKSNFIEDMNNMEEVLFKLAKREDIWQDRFVYAIAKAVWDILYYIMKGMETNVRNSRN